MNEEFIFWTEKKKRARMEGIDEFSSDQLKQAIGK